MIRWDLQTTTANARRCLFDITDHLPIPGKLNIDLWNYRKIGRFSDRDSYYLRDISLYSYHDDFADIPFPVEGCPDDLSKVCLYGFLTQAENLDKDAAYWVRGHRSHTLLMVDRRAYIPIGAAWEICEWLNVPYPKKEVEKRTQELLEEARQHARSDVNTEKYIAVVEKGLINTEKSIEVLVKYAMGPPINEDWRKCKPVLRAMWAMMIFEKLYWSTALEAAKETL